MPNPSAQKVLVDRFIDWELVERRLGEYDHIGSAFPLADLKASADKPPYYCHYMAWRLGTWYSEHLFEHFNRLLGVASGLDGWDAEFSSLRLSSAFEEYWSLLWQLQVADLFCRAGTTVAWNKKGPDLSVTGEAGSVFYAECYSYRKSFGIEAFVDELVRHVDPKLSVKHR